MKVLNSVPCGFVLCCLLYGVISASVNFLVETFSPLVEIQFSDSCKYACCCLATVSCSECLIRIVRLSSYERTCVFGFVDVVM